MDTQPTISKFVREASYESRNYGWMKNAWIQDRIDELASQGKSQAGLARAIGITPPRIVEIITDDRKVKMTELQPLAEYLDMPIATVLTRLGAVNDAARFIDLGSFISVDVVGFVQAGLWREAVEVAKGERASVMVAEIPGAKRLFALEVRGDSMNLELKHGDVVVCQSVYDYAGPIEKGMFVIVERHFHDEIEATVKQLDIINGEYWLFPRSTNPEFTQAIRAPRPEEWANDETAEVRVIAIVLRAIQNKLPTA